MTIDQAYRVIGVSRNSTRSQVEQAYKSKLQNLHLQMIPGQPLAVRQRAEQQVAHLKTALEVLQMVAAQAYGHPWANAPTTAQPQPAAGFPQQQSGGQGWTQSSTVTPLSNRAVVMSFLIAGFIMLVIILLCFDAFATSKGKKSAQLRVLSVPWCYVEIDGKKLGSSGQPKPFELVEGKHKLNLRRNNKVLTRKIQLTRGSHTVVKAQFEKGRINVSQE